MFERSEIEKDYCGIPYNNLAISWRITCIFDSPTGDNLNGQFIMTREGDCYYIFFNDEKYICKIPINRENLSMPYERDEYIDSINLETSLNVYVIQDVLLDIQIWLIRQFHGGIDI